METKTVIRKQKLALRNQLTPKEQQTKSRQITNLALKIPAVAQAEYVLCYANYQSEVSTKELIAAFLQQKKRVYLPKVTGMDMEFYQIHHPTDLTNGYKGIMEPSENCSERFTNAVWELHKESTVMLMPGAAFSKEGARIGYGKGFYDRYLVRFPIKYRIALCYELQMVSSIPSDTFDIPVTMIVTEKKQYNIIH